MTVVVVVAVLLLRIIAPTVAGRSWVLAAHIAKQCRTFQSHFGPEKITHLPT